MKGFFIFDCVLPISGPVRNFHFLFKPPGKLHDTYLADAIEHGLQTVNAPDVVAIVCSSGEAQLVKQRFSEPVLQQAAARTSTKVCLCICVFDREGTIRLHAQLENPVHELDILLRDKTGRFEPLVSQSCSQRAMWSSRLRRVSLSLSRLNDAQPCFFELRKP